MRGLYFLSIRLYGRIIRLVAPFNSKAALWVNGRKVQRDRLKAISETWPVIWFHCASYGEFEQIRLIIQKVRKTRPDHKILITFFSPSGYEQIKNEDVADYILYLPEENPKNIELFLNQFPICFAVFVRYEFWYGYMQALRQRQIPLIFVSSSFRKSQVFFKGYGAWFRKQLQGVTHFFVQEQKSIDLLSRIGVFQASVSGDSRFDRVLKTAQSPENVPFVDAFCGTSKILIFGSAWQTETKLASKIIHQLPDDWKVIFAPHEIQEESLHSWANSLPLPYVFLSDLGPENGQERILVVNTIGHLAQLYQYGNIAVVGGGFNDGIHNILEPMAFGMPVLFGPNHHSFWEADASLTQGLNKEFNNSASGMAILESYFTHSESLLVNREQTLAFIEAGSGAGKKITSYLLKHIK